MRYSLIIFFLISSNAFADYRIGAKFLLVPESVFESERDDSYLTMNMYTDMGIGGSLFYDHDVFERGKAVLSLGVESTYVNNLSMNKENYYLFDVAPRFKVSVPIFKTTGYLTLSPGFLVLDENFGFDLSSFIGLSYSLLDQLGLFIEFGYKLGIFDSFNIGRIKFDSVALYSINFGVQFEG